MDYVNYNHPIINVITTIFEVYATGSQAVSSNSMKLCERMQLYSLCYEWLWLLFWRVFVVHYRIRRMHGCSMKFVPGNLFLVIFEQSVWKIK